MYHFARREEAISGDRYKVAGVDINAGNALVEAIKPLAKATARRGTVGGLGGFGGLFDVRAAGYDDPLLVAATDGVGTKLKVASVVGRHDTIGIDLVAMCVNDLVVQGAEPLFFLDYFATGRLSVERARDVVSGIVEGCRLANCALIGGETAEMPGMYGADEYDLAGFAVGAVERGQVLTGEAVRAGDVLLGLASTGLHSNGFSLVRTIVDEMRADYAGPAPFDRSRSLGEALLEPTRIYVASCLAACRSGGVHAFAHITGGGIVENVPRVLPAGLCAVIDAASWPLPPVYRWLMDRGGLMPAELARVFNCGIGMIAVAAPDAVDAVRAILEQGGETVFVIGRVIPRDQGAAAVTVTGGERAWRS